MNALQNGVVTAPYRITVQVLIHSGIQSQAYAKLTHKMFGEIQTELSQIHWALVKYTHRPRHLKAVSQPWKIRISRIQNVWMLAMGTQPREAAVRPNANWQKRSTQNRNSAARKIVTAKDLWEYLRDLRGLAAASLADDDGGGVPLHQVEDGLAVLVNRQPLPLSL